MIIVAVAALAILIGTLLQRLAGSGLGLIVAPVLSVLLGATQGVLVANAAVAIGSLLIMLGMLRDIDWATFWWVCAAAVPGAVLGTWLVLLLPIAWLQVGVGALVLLSLAISLTTTRLPQVTGRAPLALASATGGLFNATAGIAAPPLVVYARAARWEQISFAATQQPVYMALSALSLVLKTAVSPGGLQGLPPWWVLPGIVAVVLLGSWLGRIAALRVSAAQGRTAALVLAGLGGIAALVKGLLGLGG